MDTLPIPPFPDVPRLPGVPLCARDPGANPLAFTNLNEDGGIDANLADEDLDIGGLPADAPQERWGIYDKSGALAIEPDTIVCTDFRNESRVSDYPLEEGAFGSYNKVQNPFDFRLTMAYAGDADKRGEFLRKLQSLLESTTLYDVVTPEDTWADVTIEHYDLRRDVRSGVQMLTVEVWAREVRVIKGESHARQDMADDPARALATKQTKQDALLKPLDADRTRSISAADLRNEGRLQAAPPTPAQDSASNYASGSAADGLNAAASNGDLLRAGKASAQAVQDMLQNAPTPLSASNQAAYAVAIGFLYGKH